MRHKQILNWVPISEQLPPKHKYILLKVEGTDNMNWSCTFVHEYDLTTQKFPRNYTHWALLDDEREKKLNRICLKQEMLLK